VGALYDVGHFSTLRPFRASLFSTPPCGRLVSTLGL
jgi:hypothetical protein